MVKEEECVLLISMVKCWEQMRMCRRFEDEFEIVASVSRLPCLDAARG